MSDSNTPLQFSGFGTSSGQPSESSSTDDNDFVSGFLKDVEEADRAIVEKYLKPWNGQVTQRFQKIHEQYAPYKNLGLDAETMQNAAWIYSQLDTDPVTMYKTIHRALKESGMWEDPDGQEEYDEPPVGGRQDSLPEYEGVPEPFLREHLSMRQELDELREMTHGFVQNQQEAQESQLLDQVLDEMHNVFGDFDEEWILTRLARGRNPQEAYQEYQQFVEGIANSRQRKPAPNVFQGSGSIPAGQVDHSKLKTPGDRKNFIAAALEAAQQG